MNSLQPPLNTLSSNPSDAGAAEVDRFMVHPANIDLRDTDAPARSFGQHLRTSREARGESLDSCAHALRLPVRVLRQLEGGTYDGTDSKIYLASYVSKYAQHLGVDEAATQHELDRIQQIEAPLVATGGISHSRFLLDRYATAATYVVLTAVIVVPMIWLGVRGTLDRDLSHLAPLDAAPVAQQDARPLTPTTTAATLLAAPRVVMPPVREQSLMASMAPFPSLDDSVVVAPAAPAAVAASDSNDHNVSLSLSAASWVEVIGADGSRMEYGLLPAGSSKTYHSDQNLDVRIGNVSGAQLSIDGKPVVLEDFRHANVARFRVQIEDGKAVAASL